MSYEILPIEVTSEPQRSAAESSVSLAHASFLLRQRYVLNANVVFRAIKIKTKLNLGIYAVLRNALCFNSATDVYGETIIFPHQSDAEERRSVRPLM